MYLYKYCTISQFTPLLKYLFVIAIFAMIKIQVKSYRQREKDNLMQKIELKETVRSRDINSHQIPVDKVSSPVLARLIEEVRNKENSTPSMYNRFHNRHNRS